jgi:hypothetical protein
MVDLSFYYNSGTQVLPNNASSIEVDNTNHSYSQLASYTDSGNNYVIVTYNDNGRIKQVPYTMGSECNNITTFNFATQVSSSDFFLNASLSYTYIIFVTLLTGTLKTECAIPITGTICETNTLLIIVVVVIYL